MSKTDVFFDSNVILYMFGSDPLKASKAEALVAETGVISVQVLNEVANVAKRKMRRAWPEIAQMLAAVRANCSVVPITIATHERGLAIARQYDLSVYDAMIVAAAAQSGCTTLYSEDMHDGLVIDGLTIRNPYTNA